MVIELAGVPGGGKTTVARAYEALDPEGPRTVTVSMTNRFSEAGYASLFLIRHPVAFARLVLFTVRYRAPGLLRYSLHLMLRASAKYAKTRLTCDAALIDEGIVHLLVAIPGRTVDERAMRSLLCVLPLPEVVAFASEGTFHRFHREDTAVHPRVAQGAARLSAWESAVKANAATLSGALSRMGVDVVPVRGEDTTARLGARIAMRSRELSPRRRAAVLLLTFSLVALLGIGWSLTTPYIKSIDEQVYLVGALQTAEGTLPDASMLEGYRYIPYLYPNVLLALYEPMGHEAFKSAYLFLLVIAIGLASYGALRILSLPWVPALLLSIVALMPRAAGGTELFGAFTFREAIGREAAMPLFWIAGALLLARIRDRRALWPVFVLMGLGLFLHPVTVTLFAFSALVASGITLLILRTPFLTVVREVLLAGLVFIVAGSYFFVKVFERLAPSVEEGSASAEAYVSAILYRNAWEFPSATLEWYVHMAIVSFAFLALLAAYFALPVMRRLRARYPFPHARTLLIWGGTLAAVSLFVSVLVPGVNLYAMKEWGASYAFQQWSRMSKFYYLGLFVALVPAVAILYAAYKDGRHRLRRLALAVVVAIGLASSTFAFEIAQFSVGYPNYERAYIPQALSGIADDTRPEDYRELCSVLSTLGISGEEEVVSNDFGLRYYCRSNLYATHEEGAAYTYRPRADLIDWHARYLAQRDALRSLDPAVMSAFARTVDARVVILPRNERTETLGGAVRTSRFVILPIAP